MELKIILVTLQVETLAKPRRLFWIILMMIFYFFLMKAISLFLS